MTKSIAELRRQFRTALEQGNTRQAAQLLLTIGANLIANWWRSRRFRTALKQGNTRQAAQLLRNIQKSGAKLSWSERLFRDTLDGEQELREQNRELSSLRARLARLLFDFDEESLRQELVAQATQIEELHSRIEELSSRVPVSEYESLQQDSAAQATQIEELHSRIEELSPRNLQPNAEFVNHILNSLKLKIHDENLLQCTGIESGTFDDFEAQLADFLRYELNQLSQKNDFSYFSSLLDEAVADIERLKKGRDPKYCFQLTPHMYLMRYFLENVYSSYIAWFEIYESGLLPTQINILDIGAGPGTVLYGLALLLQSGSRFFPTPFPTPHISYYSLEQQKDLQYKGLQFWRRYIEPRGINAFFRYHTASIFDYRNYSPTIPQNFFDFITISHCFFYERETRTQSQQIYREIIRNCLKPQGYVLLTIQDSKFRKTYNVGQIQELDAVNQFVEKLGLRLVGYKYLNSTGQRDFPRAQFSNFAQKNLHRQTHMSPLLREYFELYYDSNYTLDDYVILAQKE